MRVVFHPEADDELAEAVAYYGGIEEALGERFLAEMRRLAVYPRAVWKKGSKKGSVLAY